MLKITGHCVFVLLSLLLDACGQLKLFQPPPALYELWVKSGIDQQAVRQALLDCGYPNSAYVDSATITNNEYARGEQCMISKGFNRKGSGTYCDTHPELAACQRSGRASRSNSIQRQAAYEQWNRTGIDTPGVQESMRACGYITVIEPTDYMLLNEIAAAQLCMLDRGFHLTVPANHLLCKNYGGLPACRDKVIDTVNCCAPLKAAGQR